MNPSATGWTPIEVEFKSVDALGREIDLKNVPAEASTKNKTVRIDINEVIKAEQKYLAEETGIVALNVHELLLLYAEPKFFKGGVMTQKFKFNKMMFYFQERMKKIGYGDAFIYDKIESCRAGPIPRHLKEELKKLTEQGIIESTAIKDGVRIEKGEKVFEVLRPGVSLECKLTEKGKEIAKTIWDNTPQDIKEIALKTKQEISMLTAEQIKEKVHKDYPQYQKSYTELDTE